MQNSIRILQPGRISNASALLHRAVPAVEHEGFPIDQRKTGSGRVGFIGVAV